MSFDYTKDTKHYYKSDEVAQSYHDKFANPKGLNGLRFRFIARREREAVRRLLTRVPHRNVLDVPTGTGKMAPVFADLGSLVTPCDVSENMLALAKRSYAEAGWAAAGFTDTKFRCHDGTGGGLWDAGYSAASSSLRR